MFLKNPMKFRRVTALFAFAAMLQFVLPATFPAQRPAFPSPKAEVVNTAASVAFEENRGQFDEQVSFAARTGGSTIFLTREEAVYVLPFKSESARAEDSKSLAFALRMKFAGANPEASLTGETILEQKTNYFRADRQATDVPNFGAVRTENLYNGIGMIWYGLEDGATRYDFVVEPRADPSQIALEFDGADKLGIDNAGNLLVHTPAGTVRQAKPFSFQETESGRHEIESGFRVENNRVSFVLGEYDRSKPLTIDPTVTLNNVPFSTFLGSFANDVANDMAVDSNGNTYITGRTLSPTFPTTSGVFDPTHNGNEDVFVTKINAGGTGIVFSTFLGGTFYDEGRGIAVDATGNVYVTGTAGIAFPTTSGSYDETFNGGSDVFVTKLSPTGSSLLYSTYAGASGGDGATDLAIDSAGSAYVVVRTSDNAVDFPTTPGAFDTTHNGFDDVAVAKFNASGTSLVYSTFLGGSNIDNPEAIVVNSNGEAYVAGSTTDDVTDFPTTAGAFDTTHNGVTDFFVTKLTATGDALIYSTFIGGSGIDNANGLAVDGAGNAYVGGTIAAGFPTTAGVVDTTIAAGEAGFSKLNPTGSALVYSTYLGGTQNETIMAVAVDDFGNAFLLVNQFGGDYPTTVDAYDSTFNGFTDVGFTVLNQNASALIYSTYLGGGGNDSPTDLVIDDIGNVYITGFTVVNGAAFPTTQPAFQSFNAGGNDAFVTKFGDFSIGGKVVDTNGQPLSNVLVALSGQVSGTVLTSADGRFGFLDTVPGEPHAVSATRTGYSINPSIFNIASLAANRELIFVGTVGSPTGGSGGTLAFQNISYNKAENGGSVTVTVKRKGTITETNPVTVDFATSNGTAASGQDFVQKSGVLTFNALETTKTITIDLLNDQILEPREGFFITLRNATNNADIEIGGGTSEIKIIDEDLSDGSLLISEFRQRGRLGARDEFVKLFNPNDFDVTIQTADGSAGVTLAAANGTLISPIATIPNLVTIGARGHYLLTNNSPAGGFSLIDYPTGAGTMTAVGDRTFSMDIPDNSTVVLLKTAEPSNFTAANKLDSVGFGNSAFSEGNPLAAIVAVDSEMSFVRRLTSGGLQHSGNNSQDFLLVENRARSYSDENGFRLYSTLGAPAPETSESLRLMTPSQVSLEEYGTEIFDVLPVSNGTAGTLTVFRKITNLTNSPLTSVRLRAIDFPTAGSATQRRFSSRPDFRLLSSSGDGALIKGVSLAAEHLQPNGGGINSTLSIDAVTIDAPLLPQQSIIVAIRFGVMRYGRHPLALAIEAQ